MHHSSWSLVYCTPVLQFFFLLISAHALLTRRQNDDANIRSQRDGELLNSAFFNRIPSGAVFSEHGGYPDGADQSVELLRFITAYGAGLEVFVDVTPYVPLLRAAAAGHEELHFYSYIETWVGNETGSSVLFVNSSNQTCAATEFFDGNGWSVHADLVVLRKEKSAVTKHAKPSATVTLATGKFGSQYSIGPISVHKGNITADGGAILLDSHAGLHTAAGASVYPCPKGSDAELKRAAIFGYIGQQAKLQKGPSRKDYLEMLADTVFETLADEYVATATLKHTQHDNKTAVVGYNPDEADVQVGSIVYFNPYQVLTDFKVTGGYALIPHPLKAVGKVLDVHNGTLKVQLDEPCFNQVDGLPELWLPTKSGALEELKARINETIEMVTRADQPDYSGGPWFLRPTNHSVESLPALVRGLRTDGAVLLADTPFTVQGSGDKRVCVVTHESDGRVFQRDFDLPSMHNGSIIMQFVVTGHGWSATTEQCGEYCHAVYELSLNGVPAVNITQWRDDCQDNPLGPSQRGTWDESRNGWCPGSAEPGLYVDVTKWARPGSNKLEMRLVVWSNITRSYIPYIDYGGFALGDSASLAVGLTMFAYDAEAVGSVRAQPKAFTAAEAAIRDGCSRPSALEVPVVPHTGVPVALASYKTTHHRPAAKPEVSKLHPTRPLPVFEQRQNEADASTRFDFEARSPWYLYNSSAHGPPGHTKAGVSYTSIFKGDLVQRGTQLLRASLKKEHLPDAVTVNWDEIDQVGLHFRLSKPPGDLKFDHWDRLGSFGLMLRDRDAHQNPSLHLVRSAAPGVSQRWEIRRL